MNNGDSTKESIDEIVKIYAKKVKWTARKIINLRLYDRWLQEDFEQEGDVGLIEA